MFDVLLSTVIYYGWTKSVCTSGSYLHLGIYWWLRENLPPADSPKCLEKHVSMMPGGTVFNVYTGSNNTRYKLELQRLLYSMINDRLFSAILKERYVQILRLQLHKCEHFLVSAPSYDRKSNIFGFWIKQDSWGYPPGLCAAVQQHFSQFSDNL